MPTYRRRRITETQTAPPLAPLRGGELMRRARASAIHATGDRVLGHGRRILLRVGLGGAAEFHVPDTAGGGAVKIYPTADVERIAARLPALPLTPGHLVRVAVVALPSGQTEIAGPAPFYTVTGPQGKVKISIDYDNGSTTETVAKTITIPASLEANKAQPSGIGAAWGNLHRFVTDLFRPADMNKIANVAAWSDGVTAEITVSYIGSPRVVDLVVYEEPAALAYDLAAGDWIAPMHAAPDGGNLGQLAGPVPVIKRSASDPGGGAEIVCDAAKRIAQEVGPILFYHSAWNEDAQPVADTETAYASVTSSAAFVDLVFGLATSVTSPPNPRAAWSTSGASHAQRVQEAEHSVVLRGRVGVVPVRCFIFGAMSTATGSPTAKVRFYASEYSLVEVDVPAGTTYAWHSAPGFLLTGIGAQQEFTCNVLARVSTAGPAFRWRYLMVAYDGTI